MKFSFGRDNYARAAHNARFLKRMILIYSSGEVTWQVLKANEVFMSKEIHSVFKISSLVM